MSDQYNPLPLQKLAQGSSFCRPWQEFPESIRLDSPATEAMTDLRKMSAMTVAPNAPIDKALDKMAQTGVRLLLVITEDRSVLGVITARDIQGEKPMRFQQDMGVARSEVLVRDIMTPQGKIEVLRMEEISEATIGDIVMTLKKDCRQHAIVIDNHKDTGADTIRGIFSATQICRLLGIQVRFDDISKTFDEMIKLFD